MDTHPESHKLATARGDLIAHISWREQLSIGLIFALAALIFVPTFWRGLACGHDTITHFYRVVQLALNIQDGSPFSLWSQHFMRGYGYTIYPFYAPLMYGLTTAIHFLGFDFSLAVRIIAWLTLFLAGWGGYNLGRRYFNPTGAFIVGLAYLFAPYLIYNATQRGAFPELLGLALLPWALVAGDLAITRRTPRSIITAVFTFALLMLSHNIIPNFGFIILLGLALSRTQNLKPRTIWQTISPALTIIGLTLLITSFFWLPAYIELDFTQARRTESPFGLWPRFDQHFIKGNELIGFPAEPADPALTNPPISIKIGAGQALLALIGILLSLVLQTYRRPWFWMWALITAVCLFLVTYASWPLWTTLPLPDFVQLPTRFFGPASIGIAILAGIMADWLGERLERRIKAQVLHFKTIIFATFYVLGAVIVAVSSWSWLYPVICNAPVLPTAATVAQATHWDDNGNVSRWGGDSTGETLPHWVDVLPDPNTFDQAYADGEEINRLLLPDTAVLLDWVTTAKGDRYILRLQEAQTLTYRTFYIPYWRATINGKSAPLTPRPIDGLIQIELPAGEVDLAFTFGLTPLRVITLIISGLTAIILLWWGWHFKASVPPLTPPSRHQGRLFATIIGILWLGFIYVNLTDNFIYANRFVDGTLQKISHPIQFSFDNEFTYLGYTGQDRVAAHKPLRITQYWTAENGIGAPYRFRLRITDDQGNLWHLPIGRPYSYASLPGKPGWQVGSYVRDAYEFNLLPGTPPATYWLEASAFRKDTDMSLMPLNVQTAVNPAWARVGQIEVTDGKWNPTAETAQVNMFAPTPITSTPALTLLGWTVSDVIWRPGQQAHLDLLWQNDQIILGKNVVADLWLVNEEGEKVAQTAITLGSEKYPTTVWPNNSVVRNKVQWQLPATLESGQHTTFLTIGEQEIELGAWQIDAPQRKFSQPEFTTATKFTVDFANLAGYTLSDTAVPPNTPIDLTLIWQANDETTTSYRVFVHLLDGDGNLIAQSDAIPDHWTRPTTGWISGEYIQDRHTLTIPANTNAGEYLFVIGLYDITSGIRLKETQLSTITVQNE